jgi:protein TonB
MAWAMALMTVIATIQNWVFQPATSNGQPIVSEQELLFHYERG